MCHKFPSLFAGIVLLGLVLAADVPVKERSLPKQDPTPDDDFYLREDFPDGAIQNDFPEGSGNERFHSEDVDASSGSGLGPGDDEDGNDRHYDNGGDVDFEHTDKKYDTAKENEIPPVEKDPKLTDDNQPYDDNNELNNNVHIMGNKHVSTASFFRQPGVLAAVIGGSVVGLLCAILLVMFIVYRMRKKDEGSYALDEPKRSPTSNSYNKGTREFFA